MDTRVRSARCVKETAQTRLQNFRKHCFQPAIWMHGPCDPGQGIAATAAELAAALLHDVPCCKLDILAAPTANEQPGLTEARLQSLPLTHTSHPTTQAKHSYHDIGLKKKIYSL